MLGSSYRLFSVGGTDVRVHPTFFLLLVWVAAVHWFKGGVSAAVAGVIFIVLLFLCVVLHEFGHIYAARRYGIRTPDVTLLPIGGVASLERMPEKPGQEIIVALAGPAVNLVIAFVLTFILGARFDLSQMAQLQEAQSSLIAQVAAANIALVLFNLIPAFPMDGGRVLRAILATWLGFTRATRLAANIGQVLAVLLGLAGLFGNPLLVLVAVFIFLAAGAEAGYVAARDLTRGHLAHHAMITSFTPLGPQSSIDDAAALLLRTTQSEFPVLDESRRLRGVVTRDAIVAALKERPGSIPVSEVMSGDVRTVPENACLETVFSDLQKRALHFIGVVDRGGALVGYLTPENISELVMIRSSRAARGVMP
jgi:Zn-dependent protease/CBS domain-containing protein